MTRLGACAAGFLAAVIAAAAARAQEHRVEVGFGRGTPAERKIRARLVATAGAQRPGGYGWVTVQLTNPDQAPHRVDLVLGNERQFGGSFTVRRTERLAGGASSTLVLPLPSATWAELELAVDGYSEESGEVQFTAPRLPKAVLLLGHDAGVGADWQAALTKLLATPKPAPPVPPTRPGRTARVIVAPGTPVAAPAGFEAVTRRPEDLPDRWFLMSAFDLVVVDLGAPGLTSERQRLLADHVAGGGSLLLVNRGASAPGPLLDLSGGGRSGRHGFGAWFLEGLRTPAPGGLEGELGRWIEVESGLGGPKAGLPLPARALTGPPHDGFLAELMIPGLGTVPVAMFLVLILGFVGVVGVQTWHYVRRKKRPLTLLVAVPATGLGCTAGLLLYGLFSEGLGIKGAVRSFTILDQVTHESTSVATRTLYAGLSPSALLPAPGSSLHCAQLADRNGAHRLRIDLDQALRVGGALLPSRTPTTLATVTRGPARERLRFRRKGDTLEVLADSDFAPVDEEGAVLVRDLDGRFFTSAGTGAMRVLGDELDPVPMLERFFGRVVAGRNDLQASWEYRSGRPHGVGAQNAQPALRDWMASVLRSLGPGGYVAWVRSVPSLDGLGLGVDWRASGHLVMGRLAPEDFVE